MNSILQSIKKVLGLTPDNTPFDSDIIMHINTVFSFLSQMGIGPDKTFRIEDDTATWDDFLRGNEDIEMVKTFIGLKVRLLFDPPTSTGVTEAINNNLKELEYRLYISEQNSKES